MERRVTVRDIAKKTGHHYSTVSLALRGALRIPAGTRETICRVAREMGYCPDPMVKALAYYRAAIKPPTYRATLAWLVNDSQSVFRGDYNFKRCLQGAQQCAEGLGYKLEEFLLRSPGMTPARMRNILLNRGVNGILVAPQPNRRIRMRIPMDWSQFAAVSFGYTLAFPTLHCVASDHFRSVKLVVRKLRSMGYRRIGLCVHRIWNGRVNEGWLGGYLSETWNNPSPFRIDPLLVEGWESSRIRKWINANRLDAVIVDDCGIIDRIKDSLRVPIPLKLGAASLQVYDEDMIHSGIYQNGEEIGRQAVHLLVGMLHANQRGTPVIPQTLLIEGTWREGTTTRRGSAA